MMQKLQTALTNFKYNSFIQKGVYTVEWFRYDLNEDLEENISGFTPEEERLFERFVLDNECNFSGPKNVHLVQEEDLPILDIYEFVPNERRQSPEYLILKPAPRIDQAGSIMAAIEIQLLNEAGTPHHRYDLPFGALGVITDPRF